MLRSTKRGEKNKKEVLNEGNKIDSSGEERELGGKISRKRREWGKKRLIDWFKVVTT